MLGSAVDRGNVDGVHIRDFWYKQDEPVLLKIKFEGQYWEHELVLNIEEIAAMCLDLEEPYITTTDKPAIKTKAWWDYSTVNGTRKEFIMGGFHHEDTDIHYTIGTTIIEEPPICIYRDDFFNVSFSHNIGSMILKILQERYLEIADSIEV